MKKMPLLMLLAVACAPKEISGPRFEELLAATGGSLVGVFEGKVPCDDCERVKNAVALFQEPSTRAPTTYLLREIFVGKGDAIYDSRGTWKTAAGTAADPGATVLVLEPEAGGAARYYQRVDENILLELDEQKRPRVGNASHS